MNTSNRQVIETGDRLPETQEKGEIMKTPDTGSEISSILNISQEKPVVSTSVQNAVDAVMEVAKKMHNNAEVSRNLLVRLKYLVDVGENSYEDATKKDKDEKKESIFHKGKRYLLKVPGGKYLYKAVDKVNSKTVIDVLRKGEFQKFIDDTNKFGENVGAEYEELLKGKKLLAKLVFKAEFSLKNLQEIENPNDLEISETQRLFTNIEIWKTHLQTIEKAIKVYEESVLTNFQNSRNVVIHLANSILAGTIAQTAKEVAETNEYIGYLTNKMVLLPQEQTLKALDKLIKNKEKPLIADETLKKLIENQRELEEKGKNLKKLEEKTAGNNSPLLTQLQKLNNEGNTK